jgi:hypothetical protein
LLAVESALRSVGMERDPSSRDVRGTGVGQCPTPQQDRCETGRKRNPIGVRA